MQIVDTVNKAANSIPPTTSRLSSELEAPTQEVTPLVQHQESQVQGQAKSHHPQEVNCQDTSNLH